jgi:putative redox protein
VQFATAYPGKNVNVIEGSAEGNSFIRVCHASSGNHTVHSDLTVAAGGSDAGMSPKQLLMSALGSCTAMTIRTFFENSRAQAAKAGNSSGWASATLDKVSIGLTEHGDHPHIPSSISISIALGGNLTEEQKARLVRAAENCPVKKIMTGSTKLETVLSPVGSS